MTRPAEKVASYQPKRGLCTQFSLCSNEFKEIHPQILSVFRFEIQHVQNSWRAQGGKVRYDTAAGKLSKTFKLQSAWNARAWMKVWTFPETFGEFFLINRYLSDISLSKVYCTYPHRTVIKWGRWVEKVHLELFSNHLLGLPALYTIPLSSFSFFFSTSTVTTVRAILLGR